MNLFEGSDETSRASQVRPLIEKWSRSGLLEGLKSNNEKSTVAVLLENQAKQLIKEGSTGTAGTNTGGYEQWHGVALPLVRRIFAEIAAKETADKEAAIAVLREFKDIFRSFEQT